MIEVYTDGACSKNGQKLACAGWGAIGVVRGEVKFEIFGRVQGKPTNQTAELSAAINALNYCKNKGYESVKIITDSAYLCNCYKDKWWVKWKSNGWKNAKGNSVENKEMWEKLIPYFKDSQVSFEKIKGHSNHTFNDRADELARKGCKY